MTALTVVGPGLVGCYLGAAADAARVVLGPSGRLRAATARTPDGVTRRWNPTPVTLPCPGPVLVCTRVPRTPAGLDPAATLLAQNGLGQDLPGIACFLAVDRDEAGVVHAWSEGTRLVLRDPGPSWAPVVAAWRAAGITVELRPDALGARWEKCILNATVGPLCLATGLSMRAVMRDPALAALVHTATEEGARLAARVGHPVADDFLDRAAAFFAGVGDHRPSVVEDPCELPWVLGTLLTQADQEGMSTPALRAIAWRVDRRLADAPPAAEGSRR